MAKVTELPDSPEGPHGLTTRQLKILGAIKDALENNGYPPSMREIGVVAAGVDRDIPRLRSRRGRHRIEGHGAREGGAHGTESDILLV